MTVKLYDLYPYETEFDAVVLTCVKNKDLYEVILDKTLFFPLEGGQTPDKGIINNIEVVDVQIKNDVITHFLKGPLVEGTICHGEIDWNHRYKNMQMHSGEHIFTGLIHTKYGFDNVGFHLSDNSATMDYNGKISDDDLREIEKLANQIIYSNIPIYAYYPNKDELSNLKYRSKKELSGDVRIVSIENVDICACCAPHVKTTGEIGIIKVISSENYKGGTRVNYLCGYRALELFDESLNSLKRIQNTLSVKSGNEADAVDKLSDSNKKLMFEYVGLKNKLIANEISIKYDSKDNSFAYWVGSKSESDYIKYAVNTLQKYCNGICASFVGDDEDGYRYIIESNDRDLSDLSTLLKDKFLAKGGGRSSSIQGTVSEKLSEILETIRNYV